MADDDLVVRPGVAIPRAELRERFGASGGPGGQHANKAATRVELSWDLAAAGQLAEPIRDRLVERFGPVVRVVVDDERSQLRNRALAEERLVGRIRAALHDEAPRRATRPSRRAVARRVEAKRRRGDTKANRRRPDLDG